MKKLKAEINYKYEEAVAPGPKGSKNVTLSEAPSRVLCGAERECTGQSFPPQRIFDWRGYAPRSTGH
jgi:hypothetical protein